MSVGGVMLIEDLDLVFFFPKQRHFIVCLLLGEENGVFWVGCCSGVLGLDHTPCFPPPVPALHPAQSLAVGSLSESVFCHVLLAFLFLVCQGR